MGNFGLLQKRRNDDNNDCSIANNDGSENYSIAKNSDNDLVTLYGHTPLHHAVSMRERNAVAYLASNSAAFINAKDYWGRTALHYAIGDRWLFLPRPAVDCNCDIEIVKMLLSYPDIDLNAKDNAGETPLMWAVKIGNIEAVSILLRKNADPSIPNSDNQTPLHEALLSQYPNSGIMILALLSYGADIYCADNLWRTPIDILVRKICDDQTLSFAKMCVRRIVFQYHIRESLQPKLKRVPALSEFFKICCEEMSGMKKHIIYDKITVHDFVADCFQCRGKDPIEEIYKPVVDILLSKSYHTYLNLILFRVPEVDLRGLLKRTARRYRALDQLTNNASHLDMLEAIERFYHENF